MFARAQRLRDDFAGCDERTVGDLKAFLLEQLVAPEHRTATGLRLRPPYSVREDMVVIDAIFTRHEVSVVLKTIIDSTGALHTTGP